MVNNISELRAIQSKIMLVRANKTVGKWVPSHTVYLSGTDLLYIQNIDGLLKSNYDNKSNLSSFMILVIGVMLVFSSVMIRFGHLLLSYVTSKDIGMLAILGSIGLTLVVKGIYDLVCNTSYSKQNAMLLELFQYILDGKIQLSQSESNKDDGLIELYKQVKALLLDRFNKNNSIKKCKEGEVYKFNADDNLYETDFKTVLKDESINVSASNVDEGMPKSEYNEQNTKKTWEDIIGNDEVKT